MAHILVVDDVEGVRRSIAAGLKRAGHTVDEADSGVSALSTLRSVKPDLVITDMLMPEMDGLDLIDEIKSGSAGPYPVLAISGGGSFVSTGDALKVAETTADGILEKPFDSTELDAAVRALLGEVQK
ncbi:response regulator [Roseibium alexandrii]|uniref:Response regulator n=1 Tax=Roseibium alexandrii (strain DSM 17067 / NCIMB 14079 / DFL-11) TaxID=244592 RepID=A0A5E8H0I7_ROSAD|nr:response regulator [Roseibium alexandrii]EEE45996.2 Response regulator [Roseibium alexandrii DFL-11]